MIGQRRRQRTDGRMAIRIKVEDLVGVVGSVEYMVVVGGGAEGLVEVDA